MLWLGYTEASCHVTNFLERMKYIIMINTYIVLGGNQTLKVTYPGDKIRREF